MFNSLNCAPVLIRKDENSLDDTSLGATYVLQTHILPLMQQSQTVIAFMQRS